MTTIFLVYEHSEEEAETTMNACHATKEGAIAAMLNMAKECSESVVFFEDRMLVDVENGLWSFWIETATLED